MKKILKRIKTKFLFFILDNFVYSYSAVGLALMLNVNLIAFLVCDILMILIILESVLRVPDFKVIKISDLAKANLFLIMVWLSCIFSLAFNCLLHTVSSCWLRGIHINLPTIAIRVKMLCEWVFKLHFVQRLHGHARYTRDRVQPTWLLLYCFLLKLIFEGQRLE